MNPGIWLMDTTAGSRKRRPAAEDIGRVAGARDYAVQHGVAVVPVTGPLSKDPFAEVYGGSNSLRLEASVRQAAADPEVGALFLLIDSPGGDVAGTEELGAAVMEARKSVQVHAHIEDLGASAAYWIASQADTITANPTAWVGSIGTLMVIPDTSKAWEQMGVKWNVVASPAGEFKGLLTPSAGIDEKALEYAQGLIEPLTAEFKAAIARGRGKSPAWAEKVAIGKMWGGREALELGLIDAVALKAEAGAAATKQAAAMLRARGRQRAERTARRAVAGAQAREMLGLKKNPGTPLNGPPKA